MKRQRQQIREDLRLAAEINQQLTSVPNRAVSLSALTTAMGECERWQRRREIATARGWHAALRDNTDRLLRAIDVLRQRTQDALEELASQVAPQVQPSVSEVFRDLRSLRNEFELVTIDRASKRLTVRTSEIVLEDVFLGSFDIQLCWDAITESLPFSIVAVDPNPAGADESTTHPHVQNENLCAGEGSSVIRRALAEGRIFDFFCVVDRILRTYNSASTYVSLSDWDGVACSDCGSATDRDQCGCCEKCESDLCTDCSRGCCVCSDRYCTDCVSSCTGCDDDCCQTCLRSCDDCGESFCPHCITKGNCDDCANRQNEEQAEREARQSGPALHPVCVGQTAVPA